MNNKFKYNRHHQTQEGAALAIGLILLLIITLMGYTSMKGTILQEKMAAGLHNRTLASGGANSALRAGETYLYNMIEDTNGVAPQGTPGGSLFDIYSYYAVAGDASSGINPRLTAFIQRDFTSPDGTEHAEDFANVTQEGAALSSQPQYMIYHFDAPTGAGGGSGSDGGTQEFGAGGGGGAGSGGGEQQSVYRVVGKSPSGDGRTIAIVESLYTVIGSSNTSQ